MSYLISMKVKILLKAHKSVPYGKLFETSNKSKIWSVLVLKASLCLQTNGQIPWSGKNNLNLNQRPVEILGEIEIGPLIPVQNNLNLLELVSFDNSIYEYVLIFNEDPISMIQLSRGNAA